MLAAIPVGFGDSRGPGQRNHDALETAPRLALGIPDIPQSSGMRSRVLAMLSLAGLIQLDGASALCDAWLAARAGEPGFFTGPAAESIACNGQVAPVITGTPDWDVLSQMADVFLDAHGIGEHARPTGHASAGTRRLCGCTCGGCTCPPPAGLRGPLSPAARLALEQTLLAMSIKALSGPGGLAGFLRASLLSTALPPPSLRAPRAQDRRTTQLPCPRPGTPVAGASMPLRRRAFVPASFEAGDRSVTSVK